MRHRRSSSSGLCQIGCLGVGFKENGVKQLLLVGEELHILDIEGKYLGREFEEGGGGDLWEKERIEARATLMKIEGS
jgi:hypothetical protein